MGNSTIKAMRAINSYTLSYLLLLVSTIPAGAGALLPSIVLAIQSNQSLDLETPSLASALSAPPFTPKPPAPPAPTATPRIECFGPNEKSALAIDAKDCDVVIELLLHTPPGPMEPQTFSRTGAEGTHKIPEAWQYGNCQIMISSRYQKVTWDTFRYVDIIMAAQNVVKICVPRSESALGGVQFIGIEGFYVAVNGLPQGATGNVTGDGNGINTTAMAMGTAVETALPTGVVQGDGLDEDVELSMMM